MTVLRTIRPHIVGRNDDNAAASRLRVEHCATATAASSGRRWL